MPLMLISPRIIQQLKKRLENDTNIIMAFIFGSQAKEKTIAESDCGITVYYQPAGKEVEWENTKEYPDEDRLGLDIERIVGVPVDLIILNRAPASFAAAILRSGKPLFIKNKSMYWRFFLLTSAAAEDYYDLMNDWIKIRARSASLSNEDKKRLIKITDFLEQELQESDKFQTITQKEYEENSDRRRNTERWAENIVNASIDIAKIILAKVRRFLDTVNKIYPALLQFAKNKI